MARMVDGWDVRTAMNAAELAHIERLDDLRWAARVLREEKRGGVKDRTYQQLPLGQEVKRFLDWFANEYGARPASVEQYEQTLYLLALDYADLQLVDFEPPVGSERIRDFLAEHWGHTAPGTRAKATSVVKSFTRWAVEFGKLNADPALSIRRPKQHRPMRKAHDPDYIRGIILAQPRLRDRLGIELMGRLGLRKNELRTLKIEQIDLAYGDVRVKAKGGGWDTVPLVYEDLRLRLERHILEQQRGPDEFLLYPHRVTPHAEREYRHQPLESSAMHRWWQRCLKKADVPAFPMHELRHTAITEFYRLTGDAELTRMFARHASVATTVDIYTHLSKRDLVDAMKKHYVPFMDEGVTSG